MTPTAVGELEVAGAHPTLILIHPPPPGGSELLAAQATLLDAVADLAHSRESAVVMGDFNATPWSRAFRDLVSRSGLCDSRAGFGIEATFPAWSFALRIPIDHLLASCTIGVRDRWVARDVGSDHLPVVIDLALPRPGR